MPGRRRDASACGRRELGRRESASSPRRDASRSGHALIASRIQLPSAALCLYCWAIIRPFSGRSRPIDRPRTSGIHRTRVQPVRRVEGELDEQRQADDDEADDHHDEDGRAVAGIGEGEIEAAVRAARRDGQEAVEQAALAAARATPPPADWRPAAAGRCALSSARFIAGRRAPSIGAPQPPQT